MYSKVEGKTSAHNVFLVEAFMVLYFSLTLQPCFYHYNHVAATRYVFVVSGSAVLETISDICFQPVQSFILFL